MSFREMCSKARLQQENILEYQNSRTKWLLDTLKVVEEVGLAIRQYSFDVRVLCYDTPCWDFKIETGTLLAATTAYRWTPHKQGKHHRIIVTSHWKGEGEVIIDQIEKGEEGLAELRISVQTWLAGQLVKRDADRLVQQYRDMGYTL